MRQSDIRPHVKWAVSLVIADGNMIFVKETLKPFIFFKEFDQSRWYIKGKGKGKGIYFLLSATSSMPLALYNGTHTLVWTHTYTYTVKYSTHTSIHTRQPFRRRYNVFISVTHTLPLVDVVSGLRLPDSWKSISSSEESTRPQIHVTILRCYF